MGDIVPAGQVVTWFILVCSLIAVGHAETHSSRLLGVVNADGRGLAGVRVRLLRSSGETDAQMVTDANGRFAFVGLTPESYAIEASRDGW